MVGKEPKILLVDDDELSRRMMGLLLSEKGYNYDTASNGIEAVNSVQSQSYDMVLMDLQMPLMDGFDATRKIREWEAEKKHTPIVALTAMLFDNEIQRCLNAGIDECIAKPFDSKTLFQLIDSFVNKPGQPASTKELQDVGGADATKVLDIQEALPRFGRDVKVYQDFLNDFMDELPGRFEQFQWAFHTGNFSELADSAHNLKGISGSLGAKRLSYLAQVLDQKSQAGDLSLVKQTLDNIEKHIPVLQAEISKKLFASTGNQKS